jgi:hypothetical protein
MTAAAHRRDGDPVAGFEIRDLSATGHHFAGNFMAEDAASFEREGFGIFRHVKVGAANAAGGNAQQYLVGAGLRRFDRFDVERSSDCLE